MHKISACFGVALTAMMLDACSHQEQAHHVIAIPVLTQKLVRGTITTRELLDGHVSPYFQSNLATEQAGTLVHVYANEGDHIQAGEVLAQLDAEPLRAQLTEANGSRVQAVAKLSQSSIQEPITAQSAHSALDQANSSLRQAQHQLLTDSASIAQAKLTDDADRRLLSQGYVAEQTYRQADASYVASLQTLRIDQEKVDQAKAALSAAQSNLANVPLQKQVIAENQGAVTSAIGDEKLLNTQITETTLTAPFDGVVTQRLLDPGAYASQSQPIFALAQIDPVYVDFDVHDTDLPFTEPHTPVTFSASSYPNRVYATTIATLDSVPISGTLMYHARLIVPNHDDVLRGGMLVSVKVTTAQHRAVLLAPRTAITQTGNGGQLFIVADQNGQKVARLISVQLGLQNDKQIEVSGAGLTNGTTIIATRPDNLANDSPISI